MARKHLLDGLMEWTRREEWRDRFEEVLDDHVLPTCDETGLEPDEIVSTLGEDYFMRTVWACAFEDMLTRTFEDGSNIVDDYLAHRGSKETASVRAYIAALRDSAMSLYEVSDVVLDKSFRARDLVRGGEPVLISERLATRFLKQWDRFAGRVLQVEGRTQISGALLPYEHQSSEDIIDGFRRLGKLSRKDKQALAKTIGEEFDAAVIARLSETERLRASSPTFTNIWLLDAIDQAERDLPDLRNFDGDELVMCTVCYPLAAGTTEDDIRTVLDSCADLRPRTVTQWNWVGKNTKTSAARAQSSEALTVETTLDDGALSLGHLELDGRTLVLSVNSRQRAERGCAMLSAMLGERLGQPSVETKTVEQMLASRDAHAPQELDLSEEEHRAIIHQTMDRHYRETLDEPVPALGNKSPRAAVKTKSGRAKVVDWLKMMENRTAKAGESNPAMASYSFDWIWVELGVAELRR
ncbi:hypothetical protein J6524_11155 [Bradyrhizobium sp. WSM 1738]|uniref:hypothetical protein n=1 Tax=Bradyrhizobium hereditatis TaxID=2821405 RepID=UPI001CE361E2|nr:hypothetical protein [Bradyrhizobium hereditatis]MCA6115450.1 hypothetical protein [Bradyrhizobium hereditatis]